MSKYDPDYYKGGIEVWDFIAAHNLDFFSGAIVKYIIRAGKKPHEEEIDDLLKAKAFLEKKIQLATGAR